MSLVPHFSFCRSINDLFFVEGKEKIKLSLVVDASILEYHLTCKVLLDPIPNIQSITLASYVCRSCSD
jgi:hypothetical protein